MSPDSNPISPRTGPLRLYAAWGCPFCHRVLAGLHLTGLADRVAITWMNDIKRDNGWEVEEGADPVFNAQFIKEVYTAVAPGEDHRPAVPILVDEESRSLVTTESPAMLRYISTGFAGQYPTRVNLCPDELRAEISELNSWVHENINRAVYDVGFALEQSDYERKAFRLFGDLDIMEELLSQSDYLFGDHLTESDLFLYATLRRFDMVYSPLFRCSLKRVADSKTFPRYVARVAEQPGMSDSFNLERTKRHYFKSLIHTNAGTLNPNPSGIVPI
ncbi:MAG: glutathione S-transferase C-terminal domain-containing protein [Candidatus Rariloculaceae bacterium]